MGVGTASAAALVFVVVMLIASNIFTALMYNDCSLTAKPTAGASVSQGDIQLLLAELQKSEGKLHDVAQLLKTLESKQADAHLQREKDREDIKSAANVNRPDAPVKLEKREDPAPANIADVRKFDLPSSNLRNSVKEGGDDVIAGIVVMACNRVSVGRALDLLIKHRPSKAQFPIVVSQDCGHRQTAEVIAQYAAEVSHMEQPDLSDPPVEPQDHSFVGYYKIARHYKWALTQMFDVRGYDAVIIVEDDLDVAPDFFSYFAFGKRVMSLDPTLWCVSAWSDNGLSKHVMDASRVYRSDFFPGLGWMMTRQIWNELGPKWTPKFWDDWMREPSQRQGRVCLRPEVSRTKTFGRVGVSNGQFYDTYLKFIQLNSVAQDFSTRDPYEFVKDRYDPVFHADVYEKSKLVTVDEFNASTDRSVTYRIEYDYSNMEQFVNIAKGFQIMTDWKAGVPRTAYRGVVTFWQDDKRVHLAPRLPWNGYSA